jgi:DNA excision repair protein ERCC-2
MRFTIGDPPLEVIFPYDYIYPEQKDFIEHVYRTLVQSRLGSGADNTGAHCVIEMPTGTGKTVSMLSVLLAYQYKYPDVGKIIYCTRTVPEMTKALEELKHIVAYREREILRDQAAYRAVNPHLFTEEAIAAAAAASVNVAVRDAAAVEALADGANGGPVVGVDIPDPGMMRSPSILGVCLSSRRNMCIHPVVAQFDHQERVDTLCRTMTASFVRDKKLDHLSRGRGGITADADHGAAAGSVGASTGAGARPSPVPGPGCGSCFNSESCGPAPSGGAAAGAMHAPLPDLEELDRAGLCSYNENLEANGQDLALTGVYTIDDLKQLGEQRHWCPYFTARRLIGVADVVVYNYHYMLDPKIAGLVSRDIDRSAIVVFDEAHNIDNICIEALSITLNKGLIHAAGRSLTKLRRLTQEAEAANSQRLQDEYQQLLHSMTAAGTISADVAALAASPILESDLPQDAIPGSIRRAKHFILFLKTFVEYLKTKIEGRAVTSQTPPAFFLDYERETNVADVTGLQYSVDRLGMLLKTLEVADMDEFTPLVKICSFGALAATYNEGFVVLFEPFDDHGLPDARLMLCCVDAALAIRPVLSKYRSVIIMSGTLSPLDMYPKMLDFRPVVAESLTMSLSRAVVLPLVVSKGNDQNPITTSFSAREDNSIAANYGAMVLALARNVPDGVVVFFPSYSYMERMVSQWCEQRILDQIGQYKLVFLETKDIEETTLALAAYKKACMSGRGAVFMSIARGKVAEGIDFSGPLGRAVALIGVPYQYTRSRVLLARLEFLRTKHDIAESDFLHFDALRQASQCLGRIVRSKSDYGLMIFADQRYSRADMRRKLPRWIQQFMLPENLSVSTEAAMHAARAFLLKMAQPHNRADDLGTILLSEEQVRARIRADNQRRDIHGIATGEAADAGEAAKSTAGQPMADA